MNIQKITAVLAGKTVIYLSRFLNLGGGSAAPGLVGLNIYPNLISDLASQIQQSVAITGTNGKTTTAKILSHLLKSQDKKIIINSTGSNLERGIASTLLQKSNWLGQIKDIDIAIWELDEAAFNRVIFDIKPQILVFLNVFRDQLDRYGEVDKIASNWQNTLQKVTWNPILLINAGDAHLTELTNQLPLHKYTFKVTNHQIKQEKINFKLNLKRPTFQATILENKGLAGNLLDLTHPKGKLQISFKIPGVYHVYDLLAAASAYLLLNQPAQSIVKSLDSFSPAFGRVETITICDKKGYIFLIKNPAGVSLVLETIIPEINSDDRILIGLNDNFADGTDVSWIWDGSFEQFANSSINQIICTGNRAADLAVRLKYAGVATAKIIIESSLENAFASATSKLTGNLFILPTYTVLLDLQKLLAKKGVKNHYWKE